MNRVEERRRGTQLERDVEQKRPNARLTPAPPKLVDEDADLFVTGARAPQILRNGAQSPVRLGDRLPNVVETNERCDQSGADSWSCRGQETTACLVERRPRVTEPCRLLQVTVCYLELLRSPSPGARLD